MPNTGTKLIYLCQYQWDESAFHADRNGLPDTQGPGESEIAGPGGDRDGYALYWHPPVNKGFRALNPLDMDDETITKLRSAEFTIQGPDDTEPYVGRFDGGPSRPPSRISNSKFSRGKIRA